MVRGRLQLLGRGRVVDRRDGHVQPRAQGCEHRLDVDGAGTKPYRLPNRLAIGRRR